MLKEMFAEASSDFFEQMFTQDSFTHKKVVSDVLVCVFLPMINRCQKC